MSSNDSPRRIVYDDPENVCFGCSPHNARGLRMEFQETVPGQVECHYTAERHWCGAPDVVHGGVQAALLDEVMGVAVHSGEGERAWIVTAELRLRYRRPVPAGKPLVIRGHRLRSEGDDVYVEGRICDESGTALTTAESRWRRLGDRRDG
jgi:uncharacterized protein (TIGR00369 family)